MEHLLLFNSLMQNQRDQIQNRLINDYHFVFCIGITSSCFDITAGVVWESIVVDERCIVFPRYGGYLILLAFSKILIMVYLLTFYCRGRKDYNHIRRLRFILSTIVFLISIAIIIMVALKLVWEISGKSLLKENQYAIIIAVSVIDLLVNVYAAPAYLFVAISHFQNLGGNQMERIVQQHVIATNRAEQMLVRVIDRFERDELPQTERQIAGNNKIFTSQQLL